MVYFEDMGTTLEIAFDELGSFLDSEEHSSAHSDDVRNFERVDTAGPTIELTFERKFDGQWKREHARVMSFAPYCRCIEYVEGDFAGSRFVGVHRPDGARTKVDFFGDIQCKGRSPEQIKKLWLDILAKSHEEDVAALEKFRERR
jgi:hypothetical protein